MKRVVLLLLCTIILYTILPFTLCNNILDNGSTSISIEDKQKRRAYIKQCCINKRCPFTKAEYLQHRKISSSVQQINAYKPTLRTIKQFSTTTPSLHNTKFHSYRKLSTDRNLKSFTTAKSFVISHPRNKIQPTNYKHVSKQITTLSIPRNKDQHKNGEIVLGNKRLVSPLSNFKITSTIAPHMIMQHTILQRNKHLYSTVAKTEKNMYDYMRPKRRKTTINIFDYTKMTTRQRKNSSHRKKKPSNISTRTISLTIKASTKPFTTFMFTQSSNLINVESNNVTKSQKNSTKNSFIEPTTTTSVVSSLESIWSTLNTTTNSIFWSPVSKIDVNNIGDKTSNEILVPSLSTKIGITDTSIIFSTDLRTTKIPAGISFMPIRTRSTKLNTETDTTEELSTIDLNFFSTEESNELTTMASKLVSKQTKGKIENISQTTTPINKFTTNDEKLQSQTNDIKPTSTTPSKSSISKENLTDDENDDKAVEDTTISGTKTTKPISSTKISDNKNSPTTSAKVISSSDLEVKTKETSLITSTTLTKTQQPPSITTSTQITEKTESSESEDEGDDNEKEAEDTTTKVSAVPTTDKNKPTSAISITVSTTLVTSTTVKVTEKNKEEKEDGEEEDAEETEEKPTTTLMPLTKASLGTTTTSSASKATAESETNDESDDSETEEKEKEETKQSVTTSLITTKATDVTKVASTTVLTSTEEETNDEADDSENEEKDTSKPTITTKLSEKIVSSTTLASKTTVTEKESEDGEEEEADEEKTTAKAIETSVSKEVEKTTQKTTEKAEKEEEEEEGGDEEEKTSSVANIAAAVTSPVTKTEDDGKENEESKKEEGDEEE